MTSPPRVQRSPLAAILILLVGGAVYALLCLPAIQSSGRSPISVWTDATYLWVIPVCASALFDSLTHASRRYTLIVYALATGFFDAGTVGGAVPRYITVERMFSEWLQGYALGHLLGAFAVEAVMQGILWKGQGWLGQVESTARLSRRWIAVLVVVGVGIAVPPVHQAVIDSFARMEGRADADAMWEAGDAVVFPGDETSFGADRTWYNFHYDPATGLRMMLRPRWLSPHDDAYQLRVRELLAANGVPAWSLKGHVPTKDEISHLFDADDLVEVTSFPHEVTEGIVLIQDRTLKRWGFSFCGLSRDAVTVATAQGKSIPMGKASEPVCVRVADPIVVIRTGSTHVEVLHKDGRHIATAMK